MEMLKVRANLEAKLKQKGIFNMTKPKPAKTQNLPPRPANHLFLVMMTYRKGMISGKDRKFELRVLARAGADSLGGDDDDTGGENDRDKKTRPMDVGVAEEDEEPLESEDEFYKQVKKQRSGKLMAKAQLYSRTPTAPLPTEEIEADGKRLISYQMVTNRGLTRPRKKLTKNPCKKYKIKHQKAVIRRKGQVRDIRKPTGPYGGEATGINANVSRSRRFNN